MVWPDGSWAFSKVFGDDASRLLASICCILAAIGLTVGGVGILVEQDWWRPVVVGFAAFSAVVFTLFWDGKMRMLADQGWIGLLINVAILIALLILSWPNLGF